MRVKAKDILAGRKPKSEEDEWANQSSPVVKHQLNIQKEKKLDQDLEKVKTSPQDTLQNILSSLDVLLSEDIDQGYIGLEDTNEEPMSQEYASGMKRGIELALSILGG